MSKGSTGVGGFSGMGALAGLALLGGVLPLVSEVQRMIVNHESAKKQTEVNEAKGIVAAAEKLL